MIYLIDDKKIRQVKDYKWDDLKFDSFRSVLTRIYSNSDLDRYKEEMFSNGNIILFHESFQDNFMNQREISAEKIRQKLIEYVNDKEILLIFFSGSLASTTINKNLAYTTPNVIYNNLEYILARVKNDEDLKIENLLFGENYKIEILLELKNKIWEFLFDKDGEIMVNHSLYSLIEEYNQLTNSNIDLGDKINIDYLKYLINE